MALTNAGTNSPDSQAKGAPAQPEERELDPGTGPHNGEGRTPDSSVSELVSQRPSTAEIYDRLTKMRHLLMTREFGLQEILTKIDILRSEFQYGHNYNPIEHVSSRVKSLDSIVDKARRKGIPFTAEDIGANLLDIAGIRLTCSFVSDTYTMRDLLLSQTDLTLLRERDYIADPKDNGYQSLHLVIEVPVFLAGGPEKVPVEIQLRTVAMDFWASLEHKIHYKDDTEVPRHLTDALKLAADMSAALDDSMERIHNEILELHKEAEAEAPSGGGTTRIHHPLSENPIPDGESRELLRAILDSFDRRPPQR
ncbi:MAG: GTP pyrophosphokinase [Ancrocorticia sp.]|uniref:GTP pyrophosphokinase n=1 Tax=Ancrocorticia sp. TaxID=2593684 RepID=UPI003F9261D9